MAYGKKKEIKNISEISEWKVLQKMTKRKKKYASSFSVIFAVEPKEDWLVEVFKYRTNSGAITKHSIITKPDLEMWIERYDRLLNFEKIK